MASFDSLWDGLPLKHSLIDVHLSEYNKLDQLFDLLRSHVVAGNSIAALPQILIDSLEIKARNCDWSANLAKAILWQNGIQINSNCDAVSSRSSQLNRSKEEKQTKDTIRIFPNPANNQLFLKREAAFYPLDMQLFNAQGQPLSDHYLAKGENMKEINMSDYPSGVYFLKILENGNFKEVHTVVIKH